MMAIVYILYWMRLETQIKYKEVFGTKYYIHFIMLFLQCTIYLFEEKKPIVRKIAVEISLANKISIGRTNR